MAEIHHKSTPDAKKIKNQPRLPGAFNEIPAALPMDSGPLAFSRGSAGGATCPQGAF